MFSTLRGLKPSSDYIGIFSAVVCLLHCLAGPIFLGASAHMHDHEHFFLDPNWNYLFLGIGFVAVWYSSSHAHNKWLKYLLWGTYIVLALAIIFETQTEFLHYVVYGASVALIIAHIVNLRKQLKKT